MKRRDVLARAAATAVAGGLAPLRALAEAAAEAPTTREIEAILARIAQIPNTTAQGVAQRITAISESFLGRRYRLDPLGEGPNGEIDTDPLWRFDAFDCLTYVETVIALARSVSASEFFAEMNALRYRGATVSFAQRNHFMERDWLPNNLANGALADLSSKLGLPRAALTSNLRRGEWFDRLASRNGLKLATQQRLRALAGATSPLESVRLEYLRIAGVPATARLQALAALPPASLMLIVRPNKPSYGVRGTVTEIAHLGLAIWVREELWFRHANSAPQRRVLQEPLVAYLQRIEKSIKFNGIILLEILPKANSKLP